MKKYSVVGNKKKVSMECNSTSLKIVGNYCVVIVSTNHGEIEVIGNHCRVEVAENYGVISLVGSNGLVAINKRCKGDEVQLMGPNCSLLVDGKMDEPPSYESQLSPFSKDLDDVIESFFSFVMR